MEAKADLSDFVSSRDHAIFFTLYAPQRPFAVAFNEVCYNQFLDIRAALGSNGYAATTINWVRISNSSAVCFGQPLGNVVFLRGGGPSHAYINHQNYGSAGDPYFRKGICNRVQTFLGDIAACSDHLSNLSGDFARTQAEELRTQMSFLYPGIKKWGMGDFNLRPPGAGGTPVPAGWYDNYHEVDPSNAPTRCSGGPCLKNDFIFGAKNALVRVTGSVGLIDLATSDHHYFYGAFRS